MSKPLRKHLSKSSPHCSKIALHSTICSISIFFFRSLSKLDSKLEVITKLRGFRVCRDDWSTASNNYHSATANSSTSKRTPIHRSVRITKIKGANLLFPKRHVIRQQCNTSTTCSDQKKNTHWVHCASGRLSLSLPSLPGSACAKLADSDWSVGNFETQKASSAWRFGCPSHGSRMLEDAQGISSLSSRPAKNCRKFVWMAGLGPLWVSKIKKNNHCRKGKKTINQWLFASQFSNRETVDSAEPPVFGQEQCSARSFATPSWARLGRHSKPSRSKATHLHVVTLPRNALTYPYPAVSTYIIHKFW